MSNTTCDDLAAPADAASEAIAVALPLLGRSALRERVRDARRLLGVLSHVPAQHELAVLAGEVGDMLSVRNGEVLARRALVDVALLLATVVLLVGRHVML